MANALPHAIGAQAAQPARQVIALAGDGGLAMLLGELLTLRQRKLAVKVMVFNNGALTFVELEMMASGVPNFGTDLDNPDFVGMARAAALFGQRVEQADDLEGALRAAFAHDGPALVDVRTAPAGTRPAAQADLRADRGVHPLRDAHHPVRRGIRARRARQGQPA